MITQKILHRPRTVVNHITLEVGEKLLLPYRYHSVTKIICLVGAIEDAYGGVLHESEASDHSVDVYKSVGKIPAELLEIRTGSYLGDDDIVPEPQPEPDLDGSGQTI